MKSKLFIQMIEDAGFEVRSYSGRGMYGNECVAIHTERDVAEIFLYIVAGNLGKENIGDLIEELIDYREDELGLNKIVYFPHMKWPDDNP